MAKNILIVPNVGSPNSSPSITYLNRIFAVSSSKNLRLRTNLSKSPPGHSSSTKIIFLFVSNVS